MKKVLITGGTGFVGSNFVHKFLELGHEVHLLVRKKSNFKRIEPVKRRVSLHFVDLTDEQSVNKFIGDLGPEIILHFATYGAYQGRQQDIQETLNTNILGTVNLINACLKMGFECFVNTGSSSEYGEKDHPMKETDLLEPNNFYGVTKSAATLYSQMMAKKHSAPIIATRLFSVYGPFEEGGRLIPSIFKSLLHKKQINLVSPDVVRDFVFVKDIVNAYEAIIENISKVKGEILNIGSGVQGSIGEVVSVVEKISGGKIIAKYEVLESSQKEPKSWIADISKIKKTIGWEPHFSLEGGFLETYKWFKENEQLYG